MRVSEIRVKRIRVNQGLGVIKIQTGKNYWDFETRKDFTLFVFCFNFSIQKSSWLCLT